ncbi:xanthine dehydrogenase FAD-binding subunit XdhB [Campylobacter sp. 2018MI01]|uniref:xanthine dehydrogenase subunit XdhB n=1 Tax=Campylobacter sp. 2018MI01 TaxID=2836735 RepID=UPI001BD9B7E4|nr:xanthine dehydrogenase subunit XdhB [Campylobacter sp. 2018MI01]MBT0879198.1 xanthine dehydrogenase FAD-binding subunit XdhB [Campylobacter sp. 2018MI01]
MYYLSNYTEAKSVNEASRLLKTIDDSVLIAGGTDILIKLRSLDKKYANKHLIGINTLKELKTITIDDEFIHIGALCTFDDIENNEIIKNNLTNLKQAAALVGGPQIRNMATIGGNICNGATSADSASSLFTLDAILVIYNEDTRKEIAINDFYISSGVVKLEKGDILTSIKIPKKSFNGYVSKYIKFAQRNAMDIATIGVSVMLKTNNDEIIDLKLAYGVAAPTPIRAKESEKLAKGVKLTKDNIEKIANNILNETKARDSWRASKDFRNNLLTTLTKRAIYELIGKNYEN